MKGLHGLRAPRDPPQNFRSTTMIPSGAVGSPGGRSASPTPTPVATTAAPAPMASQNHHFCRWALAARVPLAVRRPLLGFLLGEQRHDLGPIPLDFLSQIGRLFRLLEKLFIALQRLRMTTQSLAACVRC